MDVSGVGDNDDVAGEAYEQAYQGGGNPGPATDRRNEPVSDPSPNVFDLVKAAIERQDDLRQMQAMYIGRIGEMREAHAVYVSELRATWAKELRQAETDRINAIRAVDVGAAATLATQVSASAEALRGQVEAARIQTAATLAAALEPIQKDIQDLRRAQYEAQGQQTQVVEARDVRGSGINGILLVLVGVGTLISIVSIVLSVVLHH